MAFSNEELLLIDKELTLLIENIRPPVEVRTELDYVYEIDEQNASITILEVRRHFQSIKEMSYMPIAKVKFNKSRQDWSVYWQRANDKWEKYPSEPIAIDLSHFFKVLKEDELSCFFG